MSLLAPVETSLSAPRAHRDFLSELDFSREEIIETII